MGLKISSLSKSMLSAAKGTFKDKWPEIKDYAELESKKLAQSLISIEKMFVKGKIDKQTAKLLLDINKNATKTVLLTVEGMGLIAAEQAINAALKVIKDSVNSTIGFNLI